MERIDLLFDPCSRFLMVFETYVIIESMSKITKATLILFVFFALDKAVGILRLSWMTNVLPLREQDVFHAANNLPDLLFTLISGGALAVAFIPVLSEVLEKSGRPEAWKLFSRVANLAFLITAALAVVIALLAEPIIRGIIAPGFDEAQKALAVQLMRLNLVATVIFSISGLIMGGLQANQHFLFPALAPLLYNLGQLVGVGYFAPERGLGLGAQGMAYGVILGALLHLFIQIPGLVRYQFRWTASLGLATAEVRQVLRLMLPRVFTMLFIQAVFLIRDNLASRLSAGSVTALTYGWMIQQIPETVLGTAVATAMLPTLAEFAARADWAAFRGAIERAVKALLALTLPIAAILTLGLRPLVAAAFNFTPEQSNLLMLVTGGFLAGLAGHSLNEIAMRSFYARQKARFPLWAAFVSANVYLVLGWVCFGQLGAPGIALTDSIVFTTQAVALLWLWSRRSGNLLRVGSTLWRAPLAALVGGLVTALGLVFGQTVISPLLASFAAMGLGVLASLPLIWPEIRLLLRL